jgi:hypothetical protein
VTDDDKQTYDEFDRAVNMTASELKKWLDTDGARSSVTSSGTPPSGPTVTSPTPVGATR